MSGGAYVFSTGYRLVIPYTYAARFKVASNGSNISEVLLRCFPWLSPSAAKEAIDGGRVECNGNVVPSIAMSVHPADTVSYTRHIHEPEVLADPIDLLHVSENVVVVNKPCSIPVHPAGSFRMNTAVRILQHDFCSLFGSNYLSSAHRIDRLTSGVLMLARSPEALLDLHAQFRKGEVNKEYIARVKGTFPEGVVEVNQPIVRVQSYPTVFGVSDAGKPSCTVFERDSVSADGRESIVRCKPVTGRTHQIRVHLQWLGHPITNDYKYGGDIERSCYNRPVPNLQDYVKQPWCAECSSGRRETSHIDQQDLKASFIWLHAWRYSSSHARHGGWLFKAPRPAWSYLP